MKIIYIVPAALLCLSLNACKGSSGSNGDTGTEEDAPIDVGTAFPDEEVCTAAEFESVLVEDAVVLGSLSRSAVLVGTSEQGFFFYQQQPAEGPEGYSPVVVRSVGGGGIMGEPTVLDVESVFEGESVFEIIDGGYDEDKIKLIVAQDGRFREGIDSGGWTENFYLEIDPVTFDVLRGPASVLGKCFHSVLANCTGKYKFENGEVFEAIGMHIHDPVAGSVNHRASVGQIDLDWVANSRLEPYTWQERFSDECSIDADIAFDHDKVIIGWVGTGTTCDEWSHMHGSVKQWIGPPSDIIPDYYFYSELYPVQSLSVNSIAGNHSFALLSRNYMKLFDFDGHEITTPFKLGTDTDEYEESVLSHGENYYAALMQGMQSAHSNGLHHLQFSVVDESDLSVDRHLLYCPPERSDLLGVNVTATKIHPIDALWLGDGFAVSYIVEETHRDEGGELIDQMRLLYYVWVPIS